MGSERLRSQLMVLVYGARLRLSSSFCAHDATLLQTSRGNSPFVRVFMQLCQRRIANEGQAHRTAPLSAHYTGRLTTPTNRGRPPPSVMAKRKGRSRTKSTSSSGGISAPSPTIMTV